jgi:hypothetical protein
MERFELHQPVATVAVPYLRERIEGIPPQPRECPLVSLDPRAYSRVVVGRHRKRPPRRTHFRQVSEAHNRSFELKIPGLDDVYWQDEYSNFYNSITKKGGNLRKPGAKKSRVSPHGFVFCGVQDEAAMSRILRVSDLLRAAKVETEMFLDVIQPEQLPVNGKLVSIDEFKQHIVDVSITGKDVDPLCQGELLTPADVPELVKVLEKTSFFITIRGMQITERIQDLEACKTKEEFQGMVGRAIEFVNYTERQKVLIDPNYQGEFFDPTSEEDIKRYLTECLPKRIARNFAKMHELGLVHYFPHTGNISLVGSIYDLDSVRGEATNCGDKPVEWTDVAKEVHEIAAFRGVISKTIQTHLGADISGTEIGKNFLRAYISEHGFDKDLVKDIGKIADLFPEPDSMKAELFYEYLDRLLGEIGWDFKLPQPIPGLRRIIDPDVRNREMFLQKAQAGTLDLFEVAIYDGTLVLETAEEFRVAYETAFPERITELKSQYGDQFVQRLLDLLLDREIETLKDSLPKEERDALEQIGSQTNALTIRALSKTLNWDQDILNQIPRIADLFEDFTDRDDFIHLEHYLDLVSRKLGWRFQFDIPWRRLVEDFHHQDQTKLQRKVKKFLRRYKGRITHDVIERAFSRESLSRYGGYHFDHDGRFSTFLNLCLYREMDLQYGEEFEEVKREYGDKTHEIIRHMYSYFEFERVQRDYREEGMEQLENDTAARIAYLKESLLAQHGLV